ELVGRAVRALVAGWFSVANGGATAGDLLVRDVVCGWLRQAGIEHDVAQERALGPGVDWFRVSPARYSDVIVTCGPVGPGLAVTDIPARFPHCRRLAVGVSLIGDPAAAPFDVLLERDGPGPARPDLAPAPPRNLLP